MPTELPTRGAHAECAHCKLTCYIHARGLCRKCYSEYSVRREYARLPNAGGRRRGYRPPVKERPPRPRAKPCRNCAKKLGYRPRGLCWTCYYLPGVREQYEPESKYARRGC